MVGMKVKWKGKEKTQSKAPKARTESGRCNKFSWALHVANLNIIASLSSHIYPFGLLIPTKNVQNIPHIRHIFIFKKFEHVLPCNYIVKEEFFFFFFPILLNYKALWLLLLNKKKKSIVNDGKKIL